MKLLSPLNIIAVIIFFLSLVFGLPWYITAPVLIFLLLSILVAGIREREELEERRYYDEASNEVSIESTFTPVEIKQNESDV